MWSLFIVLFGGLYWLFKLLDESAKKAETEKMMAEWDALDQILSGGEKNGMEKAIYQKIWDCILKGRVQSNGYSDIMDLIGEDLLLIFGDINFAEFIDRNYRQKSDHMRCSFVRSLVNLALSKNGWKGYGSSLSMDMPVFYGYKYENSWRSIRDTVSYKDRVDLRFCKRMEENLLQFSKEFQLVVVAYDTGFGTYLEYKFRNRTHETLRLWDDTPLSPDTAPKPDIEAYLKK